MALSKPNLMNGWLSKALAEPQKTLSSVAAQAYNPYTQSFKRDDSEDHQSCGENDSRNKF
jgi:hypothetical protein